jgi:DNA sulfur modification protein DndD
MILDAITLQNYGVYAARQEILLTPDQPGKPIILFGGLNGGGKTTFLDAVQLAFYGPKARLSNRGKLSYRDYLRAAIHRGSDSAEGAAIAIHFRRTVEGQTHTYRVNRSWRDGPKGIEERVDVMRDGQPDSLLSEHWEEYIESYIPSSISHLFFFDAEQIKDLAEGQHASELLGTAIHSLLGLDLVDRLETDLTVLERRKRADAKSGTDTEALQAAEKEVARLDQVIAENTQTKARLRGELAQTEKQERDASNRFKKEGGEFYLKRAELEENRARIEQLVKAEQAQLRELAAGAAPLLLVMPLLESAENQAHEETQIRQAQLLSLALEDRDAHLLTRLHAAQIPAKTVTLLETLLQQDRQQRQELTHEPLLLHAEEGLAQELRHLRLTILPDCAKNIRLHLTSLAEAQEKLSRADTALAQVPDEDAIAALQRELITLQSERQQKQAEIAAADSLLQVVGRHHQLAEAALSKILSSDADRQISQDDHSRILKHSAKVRTTLAAFRVRVIQKHARRIERLMLDSFRQLLRKASLVSDLKIDPETFAIELTGGDGQPLPFDRLSAGERQLLATSLLWGLARASGRPLPTIIDTPLGRLDSTHRKHLIERYFPVASHQVILLSTDEEIDEPSLNRLQKFVGRSYHLQFDETRRATVVNPGYFWNHETTR